MEIDAELRRQILLAALSGLAFVVAVVGVGATFDGGDGLPPQGGIALVVLLFVFVLLMAVVGFYLSGRSE